MATLADVARQAGVAMSTVSYVLSGKRSVSDDTKDRVHRAIEELGYHPHAGARALASSRSNVLALIVPLRSDTYVPVMMEIAIGVGFEKFAAAPCATATSATTAATSKNASDLCVRLGIGAFLLD